MQSLGRYRALLSWCQADEGEHSNVVVLAKQNGGFGRLLRGGMRREQRVEPFKAEQLACLIARLDYAIGDKGKLVTVLEAVIAAV